MPRFVILEHDHPHRHWDLLLEVGGALRGWRLAALPQPGQSVTAEATPDHRLLYLDYEGPVSGGRGSVTRWDAGEFDWLSSEADEVWVVLRGQRCRGEAWLRKTERGWVFLTDSPNS